MPRALSRFAKASASAREPYAATWSVYFAFDARGAGVVSRRVALGDVLSRCVVSRAVAFVGVERVLSTFTHRGEK